MSLDANMKTRTRVRKWLLGCCLLGVLGPLAAAEQVILDGDVDRVRDPATLAFDRQAVLMRWSDSAHQWLREIPETEQALRLWQRMAPALKTASEHLAALPAGTNRMGQLQLILAILQQTTHPDDPGVRAAAVAAVMAVDPRDAGERATAWGMLSRMPVHVEPAVHQQLLRWLDLAPSGEDFERALAVMGMHSDVVARIETWCRAVPITEWGADRQRLVVRSGLPPALQEEIAGAAARVILEGAGKPWSHYWLPVMTLSQANGGVAFLSPADERALAAFLVHGEPFAWRLALWLRLLAQAEIPALPLATVATVVDKAWTESVPEQPSNKDAPHDRVHDALLFAWMAETADGSFHEAATVALFATSMAVRGKAAVRLAAACSIALRSAPDPQEFLHTQARRMLSGGADPAPLLMLGQSDYGRALGATIPVLALPDAPSPAIVEEFRALPRGLPRAVHVVQFLTIFPDWAEGKVVLSDLWRQRDPVLMDFLTPHIVTLAGQGILGEEYLAGLWREPESTAAFPWARTQPKLLALQLRSQTVSVDIRQHIESAVRENLTGDSWPWTPWVDCLVIIEPQHALLVEVERGLEKAERHPLGAWIFTQVVRKQSTPPPDFHGLLSDPYHNDILQRLAQHAPLLITHATALRQVRWLAPHWALGLNRTADEAQLMAVLGALGAIDAITYHARMAQ